MIQTDQQLLPNEVLAQIIVDLVKSSTNRRGGALKLVNKFFAAEVERCFFNRVFTKSPTRRHNRARITTDWKCVRCRICIIHGQHFPWGHGNHAKLLPQRWLIRFWATFTSMSNQQCPEDLWSLREVLLGGIDIYIAFSPDRDHQALQLSYNQDNFGELLSFCEAAIFLIGPRVGWCLFESGMSESDMKKPRPCIPFTMIKRISEPSGLLWACAFAAFKGKREPVRVLLDSIYDKYHIHKAELVSSLSRLRAMNIQGALLLQDVAFKCTMTLMDCLAACLIIAVRKGDRELFDFLLEYDKDTRLVGCDLFRGIRFNDNRNVQETAIACGEVEMFTVLMRRGWQCMAGDRDRLLLVKPYTQAEIGRRPQLVLSSVYCKNRNIMSDCSTSRNAECAESQERTAMQIAISTRRSNTYLLHLFLLEVQVKSIARSVRSSQAISLAGKMPPPFRADQIGSLLRPKELLEARSSLSSPSQMYSLEVPESVQIAEKQAISAVVKEQQERSIRPITDGEYSRHIFYGGFFEKLGGFTVVPDMPIGEAFRTDFPTTTGLAKMGAKTRAVVIATDKISYGESPYLSEWKQLRSLLPESQWSQAKLTIPAPSYQHIQLKPGTAYSKDSGYRSDEEYFADLARCYAAEFRTLYDAGCRNIQIDDPHLTYFCSEQFIGGCRKDGADPDKLLDLYLEVHNWCLKDRDRLPGLHFGMHLCRGNMSGSTHWVSGSYERIAEKLLNKTFFDTFYLEFDDPGRAGGFQPLRFLPREKSVVLGLVSTKQYEMEDKDELIKRIHEAAEVIQNVHGCTQQQALDMLALSPQCGFSSSSLAGGKDMTFERMWQKLEMVRDIAKEVWG